MGREVPTDAHRRDRLQATSAHRLRAARVPLNKWVIPAIGHRRLRDLTPGDIRKVHRTMLDAGKKATTVGVAHRVMMTMLKSALREGATIPANVFLVQPPSVEVRDRMPMSLEHSLACLAVAADLPHGLRWALALLYGARQGEVLGITEDCIDWDRGVIYLDWQLQGLNYKVPYDRGSGFHVPRGMEAKHLSGRFHLTRPKSIAGRRELPLIPPLVVALRDWLDERPANPWGLVFPSATGEPAYQEGDREEWYAIQGSAGVGHPAGRYYLVHECRNTTATELDNVGASDLVTMSLIGHTSITTTRGYQRAQTEPKRAAIEAVAQRLGLAGPPDSPGDATSVATLR